MNIAPYSSSSDLDFFEWLASQRDFAINYLLKNFPNLSVFDAEDIFGDICFQQGRAGDNRMQLIERGVLVERLRWRALELRQRAMTVRHGQGMEHIELSEVEDYRLQDQTDMVAALEERSNREMLVKLLPEIIPYCNHRQALFVEVAANALTSQSSSAHWCDAFSTAQREAFLTDSRGKFNDDDVVFRREVNRACRQVTEKLVRFLRTKSVSLTA